MNLRYIKEYNVFINENFDYDDIDLNEDEYLYVDESQIPNSGNGLFTSIDIEKNEIICRYVGDTIGKREFDRRTKLGEDNYFMNLPSGKTLDCRNTKCFAKYANDAEGLPTKFKNNAFITLDENDNVVLVAKRNIKSGEEIFAGYGKKYWNKYK